jgi:two-component system KDP operon response regulator KdpE
LANASLQLPFSPQGLGGGVWYPPPFFLCGSVSVAGAQGHPHNAINHALSTYVKMGLNRRMRSLQHFCFRASSRMLEGAEHPGAALAPSGGLPVMYTDPSTPRSTPPFSPSWTPRPQVSSGSQGDSPIRVLVIDNEAEIWSALRTGITHAGFTAEWASTGVEGIALAANWHPHVIILELSLPDLDGIEVCRLLRAWSPIPIIVLSVRASDADKVIAFELGADDYLTKPFSMAELTARIRVALRHGAGPSGISMHVGRFQTGGLVIDFERRQVTVDGQNIHVTRTEYELLHYLSCNVGKVLTHQAILRKVWGPDAEQNVHYLRTFFSHLRRKIEADPWNPRYLLTETGIGYQLNANELS